MAQKKILGLNTSFDSLEYEGYQENRFCSTISLLDYDAVVIDVGFLIDSNYATGSGSFENKMRLSEYASSQIADDFNTIKEQLVELLKQGRNLFVLMGRNENCYIYTGEKQFSGTGKNARQTNIVREFDAYSFLPVKIKATHVYGNEISPCCKSPYHDFMRKTARYSQYASYFSVKESHTELARVSGTEKMVAAVIPYEMGKIICLPRPYYEDEYVNPEDWAICGKEYLDALFELNDRLCASDDQIAFPEWAADIFILNEQEELDKKAEIEDELVALQEALDRQISLIEKLQKYKLLITSSGNQLEEIVKQVLVELGFVLFDSEKGRSDIVAQYGDACVVAEIKGVTKSAAEKHAAQLEKWVSQYIEEHEVSPKALLIVNGFCDTPVHDRTEDVFPHQMLKYCEARGHALITTTQLLCLFIEVQRDPACKADRVSELLACVGKYQRYQVPSTYLLSRQ